MADMQQAIGKLEAEAAKLEQDLAFKRAVIAAVRGIVDSPAPVPSSRRPADAVREIVAANPNGIALVDIANTLASVIETSSPNPRRIIQNTVNQLSAAGAIKVYEKNGKKYARPIGP